MNAPAVIGPQVTDIGQPFWDGLRQRKLMLQFDRAGGRAQFYPRPLSLYSEAGTEWREASGRGVIFALTQSRVAPPALESLAPYALALVQLDEGPRLLARVAAPYDTLAVAQPVQIDWESTGSGFPVFKPA
jgi:uncharacterized OB-fold protein